MRALPQGQDSTAWKGDSCPGAVNFPGKLKASASKSVNTVPDQIKTIKGIKWSLYRRLKKCLWNTDLPSKIASDGFYFKVYYIQTQ